MASQKDLERLAREYAQWCLADSVWKQLQNEAGNFEQVEHRNEGSVKVENEFGRWLAALQFHARDQAGDNDEVPLFPRRLIAGGKSKAELNELLARRFTNMNADFRKALVDDLHLTVANFLNGDRAGPGDHPELKFVEAKIQMGKFRTPSCVRVRYLVHTFGLINTALACMRYDPLNHYTGGESSLSVSVFDALYDLGQVRYEGFASPINCRLLGRPGVKFCSLFEDTDSVFGSLGNFFRVNLADHPGGWILDPPFIETLLLETVQKVLDALDADEAESLWFYVTCPTWEQFEGWKLLDQSWWTVARIDLKSDTFVTQESYGSVLWRPRCNISMFVLGHAPGGLTTAELTERLNSTEEKTEKHWKLRCAVPVTGLI